MNIKELKKLVEDTIGEDDFKSLLEYEGSYKIYKRNILKQLSDIGLNYDFIEQENDDYDEGTFTVFTRFKFNDRIYECTGWTSSWDSDEYEDLMGFYEVIPVEKTIIVYEKV